MPEVFPKMYLEWPQIDHESLNFKNFLGENPKPHSIRLAPSALARLPAAAGDMSLSVTHDLRTSWIKFENYCSRFLSKLSGLTRLILLVVMILCTKRWGFSPMKFIRWSTTLTHNTPLV